MTQIKEPEVLASVLDNARQLTNFYLQNANDVDKERRFQINDFQTCNIYWILAHLTWAQDFLILRGVGNKGSGIGWLDDFGIGSEFPDKPKFAPYKEIVDNFNQIHQQSITLVKTIPVETLNEANNVGIKFSAGDSKRIIINHCIRHEGIHCGHLGWLLRMHGKKII